MWFGVELLVQRVFAFSVNWLFSFLASVVASNRFWLDRFSSLTNNFSAQLEETCCAGLSCEVRNGITVL